MEKLLKAFLPGIKLCILIFILNTANTANAENKKDNEINPFQNQANKPKEDATIKIPAIKLTTELIQINYAKAFDIAGLIKDKNNSLLSKHGSLRIDPRTNSLLVKDSLKRILEIKRLISQLDIPVRQVLIEARIVNITKDCAKDLGVRFGISKENYFSGSLEAANEFQFNQQNTPLAKRLNINLAAIPIEAAPVSYGLSLARLGEGILLDLELSALESEGHAQIIASPRLIATDKQEAIIESGEEIPYQEATLSGGTAIAFKKAALILKVKPQITPDNKLFMDLKINQDLDSGRRVQGVPIILTKSITTNVMVNNAQTLVLGGIYKKVRHNAITFVPILGKIPIVGILFRRTQVRFKNEELLIFITPRIIALSKL